MKKEKPEAKKEKKEETGEQKKLRIGHHLSLLLDGIVHTQQKQPALPMTLSLLSPGFSMSKIYPPTRVPKQTTITLNYTRSNRSRCPLSATSSHGPVADAGADRLRGSLLLALFSSPSSESSSLGGRLSSCPAPLRLLVI